MNSPIGNDTIWAGQLPMADRSINFGSDHFQFIFWGIELNEQAMMPTRVGANRRKMGPATWPLVIPMPTESDRYRTSGCTFIVSGFEPNSVIAAIREATLSHL